MLLLYAMSFTINAQQDLIGTNYQDGIISQVNSDGGALIVSFETFGGASYDEALNTVSTFLSPSVMMIGLCLAQTK